MKTTCYCIFCKKHPLHGQKFEEWVVGWYPGKFLYNDHEERKTGVGVDCLEPDETIFYDYEIDMEQFEFPITAYGDGYALTGFSEPGIEMTTWCLNEESSE